MCFCHFGFFSGFFGFFRSNAVRRETRALSVEGSPVRTGRLPGTYCTSTCVEKRKKSVRTLFESRRGVAREKFSARRDALRARRDIPENVPRRDARVLWLKHKPHARVIRWRG